MVLSQGSKIDVNAFLFRHVVTTSNQVTVGIMKLFVEVKNGLLFSDLCGLELVHCVLLLTINVI